ncbi:MAG: hypothetical protein ACRDBO_05905 [Lachnospiraceae bacterium]
MYAFVWFFLLKVMIFLVLEGILIGAMVYKKIKSGAFWALTGLIIAIGLTIIFPQCMMLAGMYIGILVAVWIGININSITGRFIWGIVSFFLLLFASGMLLFATTTSNYYSYRVFYDENQEKYTVVELASKFSHFAVKDVTIKYYTYKGYEIFPSETYKDFDTSFEYKRDLPETYEEYQRCIEFMEKQ